MTSSDPDKSFGDDVTFADRRKKSSGSSEDASLGDERTLGGDLSIGETPLDGIEIVDLDARYKVEGPLGQGGMGAVVLATDTRLGRRVAIKRILGEAAGSKEESAGLSAAIARFLAEAKAIAALNHPNIVQVYEFGRTADGPFLIMEYVDGGSLWEKCKAGPIPADEAVSLVCQVCDGLAKAHHAGIIHRDIKPSNILLTSDGIPKLADFGLAKATVDDRQMTVAGTPIGTPDFMPPEQRRDASQVDHTSDLWSLAATLYQMVTGRSPKVIRLHELPQELQPVLAKALEDEKAARYRTAGEFRDALRTGIRSAAGAAPGGALVAGRCPTCAAQNDPGRKFCRGCGEPLFAPCLRCGESMPLWDEICGECGAKQGPLVEANHQVVAARQAEAEGLLGDCEFERAMAIAVDVQSTHHPRLSQVSGWATTFLEHVEKSRAEQVRKTVEAVAEAGKHEAAHDYLSAAFALEMIPESLRSGLLPGMQESAAAMLARIKKTQAEVRRLEARVKQRLAAKEFGGLVPDIEKLVSLQPDRQDVQKLRGQLQNLFQARDEAVATANEHSAAHDHEKALRVLGTIPAALVTPEVVTLRERAERFVRQARSLAADIERAVAAQQFDGLLRVVQRYLELKPTDPEIVTLRQSLLEREGKIRADVAERLRQAESLEQACRFEEAREVLRGIPDERRPGEARACLDRTTRLAPLRQAAMASLAKASAGGYATAIESTQAYEAAIAAVRIADEEFAALLAKAEAAAAREERTLQLRRRAGVAAAALAAVVVVAAAGLWMRSSARAAALATALQNGDWDAALAIEPEHVTALVGRARGKLEAGWADGAFADLERAARTGRDVTAVTVARGDARAARAREQALAGRLDAAAQDLAEAQMVPASAEWVDKARTAIVAAWMARAREAAKQGDVQQLRQALAAAKGAGASDEAIRPLQARGLMIEAVALTVQGDIDTAADKAIEASLIDSPAVVASLIQPAHPVLRTAVVAEYRTRFAAAIEAEDGNTALRMAAAAGKLDDGASDWVGAAIAEHPGAFPAVPSDALAGLPASMVASLSPAAITALPPMRNSIGVELKLVPAGRFTMGQAGGESNETPHEVTLTKPYFIGVYEVTNAQWKRVMGSVPSTWKEGDRPVEHVSWLDASEFCRRLSALAEEQRAGCVYRLPTEAEWEYACRAGTTTKWSCGDDESLLREYAWLDRNSGGESHSVGRKNPNPWGLYDMHGNVWEWCGDWYGNYGSGAVTDPRGGASGTDGRVARGGSLYDSAEVCRSALRFISGPSRRYRHLGFRLAMDPPGNPVGSGAR